MQQNISPSFTKQISPQAKKVCTISCDVNIQKEALRELYETKSFQRDYMIAGILRPQASNLTTLLWILAADPGICRELRSRSCTELLLSRFFIFDFALYCLCIGVTLKSKTFKGNLLGVSRNLCGSCSCNLSPEFCWNLHFYFRRIGLESLRNLPGKKTRVFENNIQYGKKPGKKPGTLFHVILSKSPETMTSRNYDIFLETSCRTYCLQKYIFQKDDSKTVNIRQELLPNACKG